MTKRYHDKRLLRLEFFLGQQVPLYNSRLRLFLGKTKSKWSIPFIIKEVFFKWLFQQQYQILDFLQQQYQRLEEHALGMESQPIDISTKLYVDAPSFSHFFPKRIDEYRYKIPIPYMHNCFSTRQNLENHVEKKNRLIAVIRMRL